MQNTLNCALASEQTRQRREAEMLLAQEVERIMNEHGEQEGLHWAGTRVDLMEALHVAYNTGMIQDEWGVSLKFNTIVSRVCRVLHVALPRNPYEIASRGQRRKGMLQRTFLERYVLMVRRAKSHEAMWEKIERIKK